MNRTIRLTAIALAFPFLLAACGGPAPETKPSAVPTKVALPPTVVKADKEKAPAGNPLDDIIIRDKSASQWIKAAKDKNPEVRREAVDALASDTDDLKDLAPALMEAVRDEDDQVRQSASDAIKELKRSEPDKFDPFFKKLVEDLKSKNEEERFRAADALGFIAETDADAVPELGLLIKDPSVKVRGKVAWALGHIGQEPKAAVPVLTVALEDKDDQVRAYAVESLGVFGADSSPAIPALQTALQDKSLEVRNQATSVLGAIALAAFDNVRDEKFAETPDKEKIGKSKAIGEQALNGLIEATKNNELPVRTGAISGLCRLQENAAPALPAIVALLKDKEAEVRQIAARNLGQLRKTATSAVPELRKLDSDKDEEVKKAAKEAIKQIEAPDPDEPKDK